MTDTMRPTDEDGTRNGAPGVPDRDAVLTALRRDLDEMTARHDRAERHLAYLLGRSLPERLLFGRDGRPCRLIRQALFHKSGKPRGMFRKWLILPNGLPRPAFLFWMTGADYRALPKALRVSPVAWVPSPELSPRTARFVVLLRAAQKSARAAGDGA